MTHHSRPHSTMLQLAAVLLTLSMTALAQSPNVEYIDRSSETGLQYSGQPRNATHINYDNDAFKDLFITLRTLATKGNRGILVNSNGVTTYNDQTTTLFPNSTAPVAGTYGLIPADYDNDGLTDFFACSPGQSRLYRNIGGIGYQDVTSATGLSSLIGAAEIISCSWSDYDNDGDLDLTVSWDDSGVPYGWFQILRNDNGSFTEALAAEACAFTPLWGDFDDDGDSDLILIDYWGEPLQTPPVNYKTRMLINQGDGTFVEDAWNRIGDLNGIGEVMAAAADVDNDGDLDVVMACNFGTILYLENNPVGGSGPGHFAVRPFGTVNTQDSPTDLAVFDYDLDGYQDVLVGHGRPDQSGYPAQVHLFGNRPGSGNLRTLIDETSAAGLSSTGSFTGLAAADYNRDGFTDIYLTRADNQSFFYKGRFAAAQAQNNWVGIRLESPYGANNADGIGAVVKVTAGTSTYTQTVDGGSGFASQHEPDLVFGLGSYSSTVSVEIAWPTGRTQTVNGLAAGQYHTIVDDSPMIDNTSISTDKVYHLLTGKMDWYFVWETYNDCPTSRDEITFDLTGVPGRCIPAYSVLNEQTTGVTITKINLGGGKYEHTLKLAGQDCNARCSWLYSIESAVVDFSNTSDDKNFRVTACVQSN